MKKFIIKTSIFVLPFVFLYFITVLFYSSAESPDLIRLGYFPNVFREYRNVFQNEFNRKFYFHKVSKANNKKAKILTIGDSFSEQSNFGYKNYLAEKASVLHVDRFISRNQIETLYELLNGDFFEKHKIEYVILENVERSFTYNARNTVVTKLMMQSQLDSLIKSHKSVKKNEADYFFSKRNIYFPISMLQYYFDENYVSNEAVYNVTLKTNKLFSNNSDKLLFFSQDVESAKRNNNDLTEIQKLNNILNDLSSKLWHKKIKLIVLPAPDKYDLYYDYIADKTNFPKPLFFEYLGSLKKDYIYIDSKRILSAALEKKKDIYFYDDTHWSPVASKIISDEIKKAIRND